MKVCEKCGDENTLTSKQKDDIMASLGLVKVRGAMGGVYYE